MSPEERNRRGERLAAAQRAALDALPKVCAACGRDSIFPTFDGDAWECPACGHVFDARQR